jgi:hypothetical protein
VYVVLNKALKNQVKEKLNQIPELDCKVCLVEDANKYLSLNHFIIYDEYYHSLINSKHTVDSLGNINFTFRVGESCRLLATSANDSKQFKEFLQKRFESIDLIL